MTKRVLRKQVSEKMKIYFMGVLFIVLTIGIINACNIWQGEAVKKIFTIIFLLFKSIKVMVY